MSPGAHASLPNYTQSPAGGGLVDGGSGGGAGQGAIKAPAAQAGGGGYTNLMQYLQANQDTGGTTGKAAENVVQNSANNASAANAAYSKAGAGQIADATKPLGVDKTVLGKINSGASSVDPKMLDKISNGTAGNFQYPGYSGPNASAVNVNYGGPMGLGDFTGNAAATQGNATQAAGVLKGNVDNAQGGQDGLSALTRQAYNQPGYTQGENNLDAFLAGGTSGGKAALAQAPGLQTANQGSYDSINKALMGNITGAQNTANATNKAYGTAIKKATDTSNATVAAYKKAAADKVAADKKAAAAVDAKKPTLKAPPAVASGAGGGSAPAVAGKLNIKPADNNTPIDLKKSNVNASKIQPGSSGGSPTFGDPNTGMGQDYQGSANINNTSNAGGWNGNLSKLPGMPADPFDPLHPYAFAHGGKVPYMSILDKLGRR